MKLALKKEVQALAKKIAPIQVKEQLLPSFLEEVGEFAGHYTGKLANLDAEDKESIDEALTVLHDAMLVEMAKRIKEILKPKKKITRKK